MELITENTIHTHVAIIGQYKWDPTYWTSVLTYLKIELHLHMMILWMGNLTSWTWMTASVKQVGVINSELSKFVILGICFNFMQSYIVCVYIYICVYIHITINIYTHLNKYKFTINILHQSRQSFFCVLIWLWLSIGSDSIKKSIRWVWPSWKTFFLANLIQP